MGEERGGGASACDEAVESLRVRVHDLALQLCALQRQLQMHGEASKVAAAVEGRFAEVVGECERRICEAGDALRGVAGFRGVRRATA